mgnify:CR=1 FL=1
MRIVLNSLPLIPSPSQHAMRAGRSRSRRRTLCFPTAASRDRRAVNQLSTEATGRKVHAPARDRTPALAWRMSDGK